jgi:CheY-like chemotaxis protein
MVVIDSLRTSSEVQSAQGCPRKSGGFSMASATRDRVKQADPPLVLNGPASRRLPLRILLIHSDAADVELCVQELNRAHFKVSAEVVLTPQQFAGQLNSKHYDVVLADYPSPNWQGSQALEMLHLRDRQIPCIFLTDTMQPETVAELITKGAADCVGMDHLTHLPVAIRRALNENNLRKERDQTEKKLRHSEARYRALVGNLNYGMCRCNAQGDFLDVNQALVTMPWLSVPCGTPGREPCHWYPSRSLQTSTSIGPVRRSR